MWPPVCRPHDTSIALRVNQHRHNIQKRCPKHSISRHCATTPEKNKHALKITPIDYIPDNTYHRFSNLQRREVYWIYQLDTLTPYGLNEMSETVL